MEQDDGDVEGVLTGRAEDLVLMLTGEENLGVLLRAGRVRYVVADQEESARRDLLDEVKAVVGLLRRCTDARTGENVAWAEHSGSWEG